MKKTLYLLAVVALAVGTSLSAAEIDVKGNSVSPKKGETLPMGATLINSSTGNTVTYDENETADPYIKAPFSIGNGLLIQSYMFSEDLPDGVDELRLDFTDIIPYVEGPDWGKFLTGATYDDSSVEYIVFNFVEDINVADSSNVDIAAWYRDNPVSITGVFDGYTATGYLISDPCDASYPASSRIVFFSSDVTPAVQEAEIPVGGTIPEPATATLSLLALAGLAARRRRK